MQKLRLFTSMIGLSAILLFPSCQKDEVMEADLTSTEFASVEFQLPDLVDIETPEVSEGTEISAFTIQNTDRATDAAHNLAFILRNLRLNDAQKASIRGFAKEHHTCIAEHRQKVKEMHQQILQRGNAQREALVKAYRAGTITKLELEGKLKALRLHIKEALARHSGKEIHLRIMRKCRQELAAKIESVLNPEQLQRWLRWKQNHS